MGVVAGALYGKGYRTLGDLVKRAGQIATDPLGNNPKGKVVVDENNNMYQTVKGVASSPSSTTPTASQDPYQGTQSHDPYGPAKPEGQTLAQIAAGINAKNTAAKSSSLNSIGADWNDSDSNISSTGKALKQMSGAIGNIGSAGSSLRDAYARQLAKKEEAIAGNKELITKNQTSTLRDQAEELRNSIFNNSLMLGGGASSASGAAARLLQKSMGKNRQSVLTEAGDKISAENQNEQNAIETHNTAREASYEWEKRQREEMIANYNDTKAAYDRLKSKVPSWKQADIDKESDANLKNLLAQLGEVSAKAKSYRDYINQIITGKNDEATATDMESIGIDAPAALDTPEFSDTINMPTDGSVDENATSYYNPNAIGKKRVGTDIFGNPLTYDEALNQ